MKLSSSPDIEHHTQAPEVHLAGIGGRFQQLWGNIDEGATEGGHLGGISSQLGEAKVCQLDGG